jgi:hypothetical protein
MPSHQRSPPVSMSGYQPGGGSGMRPSAARTLVCFENRQIRAPMIPIRAKQTIAAAGGPLVHARERSCRSCGARVSVTSVRPGWLRGRFAPDQAPGPDHDRYQPQRHRDQPEDERGTALSPRASQNGPVPPATIFSIAYPGLRSAENLPGRGGHRWLSGVDACLWSRRQLSRRRSP